MWLVYCRSSQFCKARFICYRYAMIVFFRKLWLFLPWMTYLKQWHILFYLSSSSNVSVHYVRYLSINWFWRSRDQVLWLSLIILIRQLFSWLRLGCTWCNFLLFAPGICNLPTAWAYRVKSVSTCILFLFDRIKSVRSGRVSKSLIEDLLSMMTAWWTF